MPENAPRNEALSAVIALNGQLPIPSMLDYVIIGGGIVGLATAMTVGKKYPKARILVPEKGRMLRNTRLVETAVSFIPVFITNPEV